jgi:hypothetical protein
MFAGHPIYVYWIESTGNRYPCNWGALHVFYGRLEKSRKCMPEFCDYIAWLCIVISYYIIFQMLGVIILHVSLSWFSVRHVLGWGMWTVTRKNHLLSIWHGSRRRLQCNSAFVHYISTRQQTLMEGRSRHRQICRENIFASIKNTTFREKNSGLFYAKKLRNPKITAN